MIECLVQNEINGLNITTGANLILLLATVHPISLRRIMKRKLRAFILLE
jgi:hypothetical protein